MSEFKGPGFDRALMRIKDFIIIGTAVFALVRWAYLRTEDMSLRLKMIETRVDSLERAHARIQSDKR